MPSPGGTIYAIGAVGTSFVKIGSTRTAVAQRLRALQTAQPFPLQVLATVLVEGDLHRIEKQVHAFLEQERRRGEWFDMPMDLATLEALIVRAVAYVAAQEAGEDKAHHQADSLGERILLLRRRKQLTQDELAAQSGVNKMTIWRLEHGAIQDVKGQVLGKMALALETTADYLLGLREDEPLDPQTTTRQTAPGAKPAPPQPVKRPRTRKAASVG